MRAAGLSGVTWIGLPVVSADLADPAFEGRPTTLSDQRMPTGELCPLELLPDEGCAGALAELIDRLRIRARGNVGIYSTAASARPTLA